MKLYDYLDSGNGYKIRLLCALLGVRYGWEERDIDTGATRTPEFLAKNPNGRVPTLQLADGSYLAESNAILWYLGENTRFVPPDTLERARMLQWMFFEQYSHEPFVATSRYIVRHTPPDSPRRAELPDRIARGHAAFAVMDEHLAKRRYFVAERYSLADIALYAYTHLAHEGGLDLGPFAAVKAWLARIAAEPGHIPITWRPTTGS